jgi:hypothetical protein
MRYPLNKKGMRHETIDQKDFKNYISIDPGHDGEKQALPTGNHFLHADKSRSV